MISFLRQLRKDRKGLNPEPIKTDSVLFIRNDHLGDAVLCLPVFKVLKESKPQIKINVLTTRYTAHLFYLCPWVDQVIVEEDFANQNSLAGHIKNIQYGAVFVFASLKKNVRLIKKLKGLETVGYAWKLRHIGAFQRYVFVHRGSPPVHETEFMMCFLVHLGLSVPQSYKDIQIQPDEKDQKEFRSWFNRQSWKEGRPLIGLQSGGKGSAENWDPEEYAKLGSQLRDELKEQAEILFILGPEDSDLQDTLSSIAGDKVKIVSPGLSLGAYALFLGSLNLFISGSTGPMHLASLMNCPTFSLFPSRLSQCWTKWRPLGKKAGYMEPPAGLSVKTGLKVGEIKKKVIDWIQKERLFS